MNSARDIPEPSNASGAEPLSPRLAGILASLRARIRWYIWLEGLAASVAWLGAACWLTLVADWFFEPSALVRAGLLLAVGAVLLVVVVEWIGKRAFRRLSDSTLAILLERRFGQFRQSLLTAVQLRDRSPQADGHSPLMLSRTTRLATEQAVDVDPRKVLNPRPLRIWSLAALGLAGSFAVTGLFFPAMVSIWSKRVLLLSSDLWPRQTRLVVDGFPHGVAKVARGADLEVIARADTRMPVIPQVVEVHSRTDGGRVQVSPMNRLGAADPARDRFQQYSYTFEGVLAPIRFDLYGGDAVVRDLRVLVVDSPTLVDVTLLCHYPEYLARPDRRVTAIGAVQVPCGTEVAILAKANKPLVELRVQSNRANGSEKTSRFALGGHSAPPRAFRLPVGVLNDDTTLLFTLRDSDGIRCREPVRLTLAAIPDQPPELAVKLHGIGSAITPQARIPAAGQVTDDYGIARVWFEFSVGDGSPSEHPVESPQDSASQLTVDSALETRDLGLAPGQKLHLALKASDRCTLSGKPNLGATEQWVLDVVTPEQLRALLEARELVLRQRFETTLAEVIESRDLIQGLQFDNAGDAPAGASSEDPAAPPSATAVDAPSDPPAAPIREPGDVPAEEPSSERRDALRVLQLERVSQNTQKNTEECLGLAESFDDICEQLVNNRVDTTELIERLRSGIADPLRRIGEQRVPELEVRLSRLQRTLDDPRAGPESRALVLAELDAIVEAMRSVLDRMIEMEDFNEAVDLLRAIIAQQEEMLEKTRVEHKSKLRGLLD